MSGLNSTKASLKNATAKLMKNGQLFPKRTPPHWTHLRTIWKGMIQRCYRESHIGYKCYGGRGIRMCQEWRESFRDFYDWAMSSGYDPSLTIDRRDNDGNYEPQNCRFVTTKINSRNKRTTRMVTAFGETKPMMDWADDCRCTVAARTLKGRLERGWASEAAISTPLNEITSSGPNHARSVSREVAEEAVRLIKLGLSNVAIGRRLGVSDVFISLVRHGKTWHFRNARHPLFDAPQPAERQKELL